MQGQSGPFLRQSRRPTKMPRILLDEKQKWSRKVKSDTKNGRLIQKEERLKRQYGSNPLSVENTRIG